MLTTTDLLEFFHIQNRSTLAHFIMGLLAVKICLLGLLLLHVTYQRLRRLWTRRNNMAREEIHHQNMLDYFFAADESARTEQAEKIKSRMTSASEKGFFRRLLVDQLQFVKGERHRLLLNLYSYLGYLNDDMKGLASKNWGKRLESIIRLEVIGDPDIEKALLPLIHDENYFVSLAAMRAISTLPKPEHIEEVLDALSRRAPARHDLFIEILTHIGERNVETIVRFLNECHDPALAAIAVHVLGNLKAVSVVSDLIPLTRSADDSIVAETALALGKIGDSNAIPSLRVLIPHESPLVRSRALGALVALQDPSAKKYLQLLSEDTSMEVRRTAFEAISGTGSHE